MKRRKKSTTAPRVLTPDDLWLVELRQGCARAIVDHLKAGINVQRPICSLTFDEMQAIAEACTARWIRLVSEKLVAESETVPEEYQVVLGI